MRAKYLKFAQEYLKNPVAKDAAIAAGYSENGAKEKGYQLLQIPEIQEYLETTRTKVEEKTGIDLQWCINRFKEISDRCMTAEPVLIRNEDGELVESGEWKFDSSGANRATEMIGRHLGIFETDNLQKGDVIIRIAKKEQKRN